MPLLDAIDRLAITGMGHLAGPECDSTPFLKSRKMRKFMGRQDELAVVAAARAIASAGLPPALGERCGLYLAVGFIPFERADLDVLVDASTDHQRFSMARFSTDAFRTLNPLLTFRCLPNMPAFHVSLNLDVQGPYWVGYPGIGQFYLALEEAAAALADETIDVALVGGVADQDNFLVRHHFSRLDHPRDPERVALRPRDPERVALRPRDPERVAPRPGDPERVAPLPCEDLTSAAGFLVVERRSDAERRGVPAKATLVSCDLRYCPADPFEHPGIHEERTTVDAELRDQPAFGPASLAVMLSTAPAGILRHTVRSRDRFVASSEWTVG